MLSRTQIKDIVFSIPFLKKYYIKRRINTTNDLIPLDRLDEELNKAEVVLLEKSIDKNIKVGLVKDGDDYEGFVKERSYFPKYERFLKNNNIQYEYYDILKNDWQEKAKEFDYIVWHTHSDPSTQDIATNKIYVLDKLMEKKCLPSFDEVWTYEDKINAHYLYKHFGFQEIPTFVSHSKKDAIDYVNKCKFPIISKLTTGSSSYGVDKLSNKEEALKLINEVFSYKGRKTYFPYQRQKDYVYFQQFVDDATFDLRIMVVGDKLFGYYRYPNKGDFRASGAGNLEKKAIPFDALEIAYKVKEAFGTNFLATDLLYSKKLNQYFIIESSIFIGVDTAEQLVVDGVPGYYKRIAEENYEFKEGKFWVQELVLKDLFSN